MSLPKHGKIDCRECFTGTTLTTMPHPKWVMRNDPGAWGSSSPKVLVLGFSKGATQCNIYENGNFDDVAFGGQARARLDKSLKALCILERDEHVSEHIANPKSDFAFGSLVRCSLTRQDNVGKQSCSGSLITKSFNEIPEILSNCSTKYLSNLPRSTTTVLMLGLSDAYIDGCFRMLGQIIPKLRRINSVSYTDGNKTFVHITHPSPANGHFSNWISGNKKFDDAKHVLKSFSGSKSNINKQCSTEIISAGTASALSPASTCDGNIIKNEGFHSCEYLTLTGGNIRNHHVYLKKILKMFPADAVGGSSKSNRAPKLLTLKLDKIGSIKTDIDGSKNIFRDRKSIRRFLEMHRAKEGQRIKIIKESSYEYFIELDKSSV